MFSTILFFIVCGIILMYIVLLILERIRMKGDSAQHHSTQTINIDHKEKSIIDMIASLLTQMNCTYKIKKTDEDITSIDFNYQSGSFSIDTSATNSYIKIYYLFLYETPAKNLSLVRHLCNHLNINSRAPKFIYSIDEAQNKIYVHIYTCALFVPEIREIRTYLENLLVGNFELQRIFTFQFKELEKECGNETDDVEESNANWRRQLFLLREQEIQHQFKAEESRYNDTSSITIGQLFKTLYSHKNLVPVSLKIVSAEENLSISDSGIIKAYDILNCIIDRKDNEIPTIKSELVTLIISCDFMSNGKLVKRIMTLTITPEGSSDCSLYFRLTTCLSPTNINKAIGKYKPNNCVSAHSMLIAYDFASAKQKLDEFNYMNNDTLWKIKNKKAEELSKEQQLLAMCSSSNPSYNLYWGKKLYLEKRYYEALLHLENGYHEMQCYYTKMNKHQKNTFYELCYLIGFCYCELKEYQRAYYFLDALPQLNNIIYTQEYINCLANSKDFRALAVIENLLTYIAKDEDSEDEETNSTLIDFINFLRRRKAYVYIDIGELEEAEKIYTQMLEEPENSDYALNELAYIQRLKKENESTI